ncbi:MAG: excinuclease ABC subunit UvrA [Thaumarchaeota archaeon]|nr:excinuclease ABC subunit UvrA [Nitrososphaerota archaeon]
MASDGIDPAQYAGRLTVRGARHHNLKNITASMPKNSLVVISGLSGSGKSSLAFDTIYAEGQRRYVESLSAYARQFLEMMEKPEVDYIEGLSPAISIQQKTTAKNPRSTVGTTTEVYDYLRLLYARIGVPHCTGCGRKISTQSLDAICDSVLRMYEGRPVLVLAPVIQRKKGTHEKVFDDARRDGFSRVRVNGEMASLLGGGGGGRLPTLDKKKWHDIEIVVDRITPTVQERSRLFESVQSAIKASKGTVVISVASSRGAGSSSSSSGSSKNIRTRGRAKDSLKDAVFSQKNACPHCGLSVGEMEPRNFSFNSPFGMCDECHGLGVNLQFDEDLVIPDRSMCLLEYPIVPWRSQYSAYKTDKLIEVAEYFGIDLTTPLGNLGKKEMQLLLWGAPETGLRREKMSTLKDPDTYSGVMNDMYYMLENTTSDSKRDWLRKFMRDIPCGRCGGKKLRPESLAVRVGGRGIMEVCDMSIESCHEFFSDLRLSDMEAYIARDILKEITERLEFLMNVGLTYLTLDRRSSTLSGGESQRIRLATQIGSNLTGVLYVLDEPTIGLHQRDNERLIRTLTKLRNLGNTVIIVEHDEEVIRSSDYIVDLGPGAGIHGGHVVFEGTVQEMLADSRSHTSAYLRGEMTVSTEARNADPEGDGRRHSRAVVIRGASEHNLKGIDVEIPLGRFVCVTGVSGSGKSTLVTEVLYKGLMAQMYQSTARAGAHKRIDGMQHVDKVIEIDQSPIGRTPRSNPATYIDVFTPVRVIFASTPLARTRGYEPGQFSFNVKVGRCFACEGAGVKQIEMQFLSDVQVTCDECGGKRYNSETLAVTYKGKNITEVLDMSIDEALEFFANVPAVRSKLQTMADVGLGYIKLGQPSTTLSGGEAQRVKLASELSRPSTGRTMYILDEPTTGLHFADVQKLLDVLDRLVRMGNTVVVIEHNMDVIRNSDWIIDLGPEGGEAGGQIVCTGTPEQVAEVPESHTGRYLLRALAAKRRGKADKQ